MLTNRFIFISLLAFPLAFSACGTETQSQNPDQDSTKQRIPVEISAALTQDVSAYYSGTATLEAEGEALVMSRVGGLIAEVLVEEGDMVKAGQVLARLDDEKLRVELQRARVTLNKLEADMNRNKELFERNLISQEAFQNARFDYESQKAGVDLARLDVEFSTVKAPISGVISQRMIKRGNMISANVEMFRITDFDPLLAVVFVPEMEMSKIGKNQLALVGFDAIPDQSFQAKVARVSPVVDQETGTFKTTVEIRDPSRQLKPGMFGRVNIVYDTHRDAITVPKASVIAEDSDRFVFLVRNDVAHKIPVRMGYEDQSHVEVDGAISKGDTIVTLGQASLKDSAFVQIVNL